MKHKLTSILLTAILCCLCLQPIHADVGNSFSGGGSSSSGSSGSSYDGYDDGEGGSDSPIVAVLGLGVFVIAFASIVISSNRAENKGIDEEATIAAIKGVDEDFNPLEFKDFANQVWFKVQKAWQDKDFDTMRKLESDGLYRIHERQLQEYVKEKKTNYLTKQKIKNTKIAYYEKDGDYACIHVKIHASITDYVLDDVTKKVLEGSKTTTFYRSYDLTFIRKIGLKSKGSYIDSMTKCPNCGADIKLSSSGQCEYCKSMITNGDHKWVLNNYGPWDSSIIKEK